MKLNYEIEIVDEISEIEEVHNHIDMILRREGLSFKKSILKSDGEIAEITFHDGEKTNRVHIDYSREIISIESSLENTHCKEIGFNEVYIKIIILMEAFQCLLTSV